MIKCLIHPITYAVVAELDPGKELKIYDENLLNKLTANGITVSREFQKLHPGVWKVYPSDEKEIFVKAFEQFSSIHLQQQGYYWQNKSDLEIPLEEKIRRILYANREHTEETPSASKENL